jgi:hypothetical protein
MSAPSLRPPKTLHAPAYQHHIHTATPHTPHHIQPQHIMTPPGVSSCVHTGNTRVRMRPHAPRGARKEQTRDERRRRHTQGRKEQRGGGYQRSGGRSCPSLCAASSTHLLTCAGRDRGARHCLWLQCLLGSSLLRLGRRGPRCADARRPPCARVG